MASAIHDTTTLRGQVYGCVCCRETREEETGCTSGAASSVRTGRTGRDSQQWLPTSLRQAGPSPTGEPEDTAKETEAIPARTPYC